MGLLYFVLNVFIMIFIIIIVIIPVLIIVVVGYLILLWEYPII